MGQFASSISLSAGEILLLTESNVTDPNAAIYSLGLITTALQTRIVSAVPFSLPPGDSTPLGLAIFEALATTYRQATFIFGATFKSVDPSTVRTDYGTVLNYAPLKGNYESLSNQISACFAAWGFDTALAAGIAAQLQPQVVLSDNTPLATYGRVATGNVVITDPYINVECLFWVAAFGIFTTGFTTTGFPTYAVVYSFSAATGSVQTIM